MKLLSEMPTEGQFVAVWEYDGNAYSDTYCTFDGEDELYVLRNSMWEDCDYMSVPNKNELKELNATYIVSGD